MQNEYWAGQSVTYLELVRETPALKQKTFQERQAIVIQNYGDGVIRIRDSQTGEMKNISERLIEDMSFRSRTSSMSSSNSFKTAVSAHAIVKSPSLTNSAPNMPSPNWTHKNPILDKRAESPNWLSFLSKI